MTMKTRIIFIIAIMSGFQLGAAPASFWDDLLRAGTRSDDAIEATGRAARMADDLAQEKAMGRIFTKGVDDIVDPAARARITQQLIRETMYSPDANLLRRIDDLTPDELSSALVFTRGGRQIIDEVPDIAARSRLLRQGGSDLVAATGIHGPEVAREAARLDMLASAGRLSDRIGNQNTIARFGELMRTSGNGSWEFWTKNVVPHWKEWAAAGAIATYLLKPELFHDALGALTEFGAQEVVKILGTAAQGLTDGAAQGGKQAFSNFTKSFHENYLSGASSIGAWLGLGIVIWVIGILLPRTRQTCTRPLRWLFKKPIPRNDNESKTN